MYRWSQVVPGFEMPVRVTLSDGAYSTLKPTRVWQSVPVHLSAAELFKVDSNFYVFTSRLPSTAAPKAAGGSR